MIGRTVDGDFGYIKLIVAQETFDGGYVATQDGAPMIALWHTTADGEPSDSPVYYERFNVADSRTAHGWIDPVSRKIVQTG